MPSAVVHRCVAKIVNIKLNSKYIGSDNFYYELGSIAPDCWRHSDKLKNSNIPKVKKRATSHFMENSKDENYFDFANEYNKILDNPFIFGYLVHLITDNYWRKMPIIAASEEDRNKIYQKLINEFVVYKITDLSEEQINKLPKVKELDISGLNNTLEYLYINPISSKDIDNNYIDLIRKMHKCSDFIIEEINKIKKTK